MRTVNKGGAANTAPKTATKSAEQKTPEQIAEAERVAAEQKAAAEKAEAERIAAEQKAAADKAEADRVAAEQKAADEKAEAERVAAEQKAADEKAEAERVAAEQKAADRKEVPALFVKSVPESFCRCGRRFTREGYGIALDILTADEIERLKSEPNLVVEEVEALLD